MTREEITVKTEGKPEVKFEYNLPDSTEEAVTMYEEKFAHAMLIRAITIAAQANARKMLSQGYTAERIQNEMELWKPGVSVSTRSAVKTVDPVKVITENFDDWTPERQEEIFALIQARFASRGQALPVPEATEEEIAAVTEGVNGGEQEQQRRRR